MLEVEKMPSDQPSLSPPGIRTSILLLLANYYIHPYSGDLDAFLKGQWEETTARRRYCLCGGLADCFVMTEEALLSVAEGRFCLGRLLLPAVSMWA
jgi:hypothetical protein